MLLCVSRSELTKLALLAHIWRDLLRNTMGSLFGPSCSFRMHRVRYSRNTSQYKTKKNKTETKRRYRKIGICQRAIVQVSFYSSYLIRYRKGCVCHELHQTTVYYSNSWLLITCRATINDDAKQTYVPTDEHK